jgi:hypothetical protein
MDMRTPYCVLVLSGPGKAFSVARGQISCAWPITGSSFPLFGFSNASFALDSFTYSLYSLNLCSVLLVILATFSSSHLLSKNSKLSRKVPGLHRPVYSWWAGLPAKTPLSCNHTRHIHDGIISQDRSCFCYCSFAACCSSERYDINNRCCHTLPNQTHDHDHDSVN